MNTVTGTLADLEDKARTGRPLTPADVDRVVACHDLVSVGALGEAARMARHGRRVTYARVLALAPGDPLPASAAEAREVRLVGRPESIDAALARVRAAAPLAAAGCPLTGFSLADLVDLTSGAGDRARLVEVARSLADAGLSAVAEAPLDRLDDAAGAIHAVRQAGVAVRRATVDRAGLADRLSLIERARALQADVGGLEAFAPLPRDDSRETPSTGYDDVRTVALARLVCVDIPHIQVDWPLYGPKLAQVALAYGADDVDGVAPFDDPTLGARRSPREDIERQIRAAGADPVERTGAFAAL